MSSKELPSSGQHLSPNPAVQLIDDDSQLGDVLGLHKPHQLHVRLINRRKRQRSPMTVGEGLESALLLLVSDSVRRAA